LHKLTVDGGRRCGHSLGVLHAQALQRTEHLAIALTRYRSTSRADAVPIQYPVVEVHTPQAADLDGCSHVGQVPEPHVQLLPGGSALVQLAECLAKKICTLLRCAVYSTSPSAPGPVWRVAITRLPS